MALMHKKTWRVGPLAYCQQSCYNGSTKWGDLLLRDRLAAAKNLFRKDLKGHFGCVNAIEFSHCGGDLIASGGDDRRVLVWNTEKCIANCCVPTPMNGQHHSNIFCLAFDNCNRRLYSGGNDEQVVVHDIETKQTVDVFLHDEAVYGISVDPINDNVFASACDDGKVVLCDIRSAPSEDPFCIASCRSPMHSVTYNPVEPRLLATANAKEGLALWDVRYPRSALLRYGGKNPAQSCMSVRINRSGNTVIALRRRLPPVMYNIHETNAVCQFDHNGYYNSCTMKSCCFAGDNDQYILSGSDDFSLYMWKLPQPGTEVKWMSEAHMVLKGHRSIANQVRFNPDNHLIISSGVEKVIKMWSPFPVPYCQGDLGDGEFDYSERPVYTHEEYINLVLRSGQVMSHDYSNQSTEEDPRMMAFFDSLVQRELEGWSTDDSVHDSEGAGNYQPFVVRGSNTSDDSNSDTLSNHSLHSGDEEGGLSPFTMAFAIAMARRARQTEDGDDGDGDTDRPDDILDMRNSFMERLDELNNSNGSGEGESSSSSTLPGQRPNSARKSITELINQKRKEYLSKAKTDKIPTKKKTSKTKQLKKKSATHTEGTSSTSSSSSSTSSSSDRCDDSGDGSDKAVSGKTRKKLSKDREKGEKRKIDQSSDENQAAEIRSNAESVMKELAVERNRMKSRMKRLKAIRSRAILDLSDSSDSDRDASTSQNKYALSMNHGNKEQGDRSGNASTCSATSVNADCSNEYEIKCRLEEDSNMPHNAAAEADCTLQNKGLEDNNSNFYKGNTIGKGVQNGNVPNGASDTLTDGATSHLNHQKAPRSTLCSKDADNCVANSVNGHTSSVSEHCTPLNGHANLVNGHGSTVSNGASTSSGDAVNVDSQPIWTEFKRFRDRVEKAHRQYRRSSSHRENSTCSSGEEG